MTFWNESQWRFFRNKINRFFHDSFRVFCFSWLKFYLFLNSVQLNRNWWVKMHCDKTLKINDFDFLLLDYFFTPFSWTFIFSNELVYDIKLKIYLLWLQNYRIILRQLNQSTKNNQNDNNFHVDSNSKSKIWFDSLKHLVDTKSWNGHFSRWKISHIEMEYF